MQIEDGKCLGWVVIDPETLEWVYRCATRKEARELADACGARIAVIRSAH
jgi:hypothetical protein